MRGAVITATVLASLIFALGTTSALLAAAGTACDAKVRRDVQGQFTISCTKNTCDIDCGYELVTQNGHEFKTCKCDNANPTWVCNAGMPTGVGYGFECLTAHDCTVGECAPHGALEGDDEVWTCSCD